MLEKEQLGQEEVANFVNILLEEAFQRAPGEGERGEAGMMGEGGSRLQHLFFYVSLHIRMCPKRS